MREKEHAVSAPPSISVIVPVYNTEQYLRRCIDSVLAQTYKDFELLLIDDGSKDSSGAICDEYAAQDARVRVFHKENGGVSSARNVGLDNAQGEWITFIDSDDYFLSKGLEILYYTAMRAGVKVCAANFYVEKQKKKYGQCEGRSRIVKDNFRSWYYMTCYPRAGAALFHVTVIKHRFFDEALCRYEDTEFLYPIMREQKIAYSSDYVMVYTEENEGLSKQTPHPTRNFIFSLDCCAGSFWERMVSARLIKQELSLYAKSGIIIDLDSKQLTVFRLIEKLMSFSILPITLINRILRRFR